MVHRELLGRSCNSRNERARLLVLAPVTHMPKFVYSLLSTGSRPRTRLSATLRFHTQYTRYAGITRCRPGTVCLRICNRFCPFSYLLSRTRLFTSTKVSIVNCRFIPSAVKFTGVPAYLNLEEVLIRVFQQCVPEQADAKQSRSRGRVEESKDFPVAGSVSIPKRPALTKDRARAIHITTCPCLRGRPETK